MNTATRKKLERSGFKVGSAADFLDLTAAESKLVDIRLALADQLKKRRVESGMSQTALALHLKSSQSRIAKMEAAAPDVSIDLLVKAILTTGAKPKEVAAAFDR
jgi:ribosome-binding protein aMBF1 (putative translation factor)